MKMVGKSIPILFITSHLQHHVGATYSVACLYTEWLNDELKLAMQQNFNYLLDTFVHDDCPIPHTTTTAKCGWDRSTPISTTLDVSTVGTNAVSIKFHGGILSRHWK